MADFSNSIVLRQRTQTVFRGMAPKLPHQTLKNLITNTGLYEIYLNGCGQMMVRRQIGDGYGRAFNAANLEHAFELAKSGELARLEATPAT